MMMTTIMANLRSDKVRNNLEHFLRLPVRRESPVLAELSNFRIKLAGCPAEVKAARRLRYRVFKEGQGRLTNCTGGLDRDRFDRCRRCSRVTSGSERKSAAFRRTTAISAPSIS